jgi:hypothetical protein
MASIREADLQRVDDFLASEKRLVEPTPEWSQLQNGRWVAVWPIREETGSVRAQLNFRLDPKYADHPSLSLIFERHAVSRIDLAPTWIRKPNPPWAINCDAMTVGNHCHSWEDNRANMLRTGSWEMPAKRQVPHAVKRVPQMLRWFAEHINLSLYPPEHGFDFDPPLRTLV